MELTRWTILLTSSIAMTAASMTPDRSDPPLPDRLNGDTLPDGYNVTIPGGRPHSRQKRIIAYNYDQRRITLPPGSILFFTPTLNIPFIRNLAKGYTSTLTISAPFKINFDDFGVTDEYNPWGIIPGISVNSPPKGGQRRRRQKRTIDDYVPHPLGDRVMLFLMIEQYLTNLGHNGRACLLRAICETNQYPLPYHGLFGEFLQMIFRVSLNPFADETLNAHLEAETSGRERGVCSHYHTACPFSIFSSVAENKARRPENLEKTRQATEQFTAPWQPPLGVPSA